MGKAQKLKQERKQQRESAAVSRARRRRLASWAAFVGAFCLLAVVVLPAAYEKSGAKFLESNKKGNMEQATQKQVVTIETDKGVITYEMNTKESPKTSARISELIKQGFYNGLTFHRVEPGFVIQGGDPKGDGTGGSGQKITFEKNKLKHEKGAVAMARSQDPNSADSQFYITLAAQPMLDGQYVVFGHVLSGMDVVEKIAKGDKMNKVTISE